MPRVCPTSVPCHGVWHQLWWTQKSCVVCGRRRDLQLHHAIYDRPGWEQLFALIPLCDHHHRMLELVVMPAFRAQGWPRWLATLAFTVHGDKLAVLVHSCQDFAHPDVSPGQLELPEAA